MRFGVQAGSAWVAHAELSVEEPDLTEESPARPSRADGAEASVVTNRAKPSREHSLAMGCYCISQSVVTVKGGGFGDFS